jgi:hypothetical protein
MKTRPGICQKKRRFASREAADAAALQAETPLRTYKCALCKQFHLTSRTKGLRPPRAVGDGDATSRKA